VNANRGSAYLSETEIKEIESPQHAALLDERNHLWKP